MSKEFRLFEKNYTYEYMAQPDGGDKSVIFKFYPKDQYRRLPREQWSEPVVFEADNLETAFKAAFLITDQLAGSHETFCHLVDCGVIDHFNQEAWDQKYYPVKFWSLQYKCWKTLSEVIAHEQAN